MIRRISPVLPFAVAGALVAVSGCSVKFGSSSAGGADDGVEGPALNDGDASTRADVPPGAGIDASGSDYDSSSVNAYQGSPLCNASASKGCYPDDPASAQTCNISNEDAGAYEGEDGGTPYACHVSPTSDTAVGPVQVCIASGTGHDGDACTMGADCAAGFECVGQGTCRHYCCDPTACDGAHSFCDIQTILDAPIPDTRVPVCMPVSRCTLLSDDVCQANETCAVVKASDGTTSCVPVGPQRVGQECETDHCATDLVCLGPLGSRTCYQLCETSAPSVCQSGQSCVGSAPEFQDPSVGICQ